MRCDITVPTVASRGTAELSVFLIILVGRKNIGVIYEIKNIKVNFILEQAMKTQRRSRVIALLFL
jgi:3,4-dihydroxy-2-butanone 4-phosphate synthase